MNIRNRVRELRTVKAAELTPNPRNWRTHPKAQQDALKGILAEVGYADALLARELEDGTLMLVDGHLRAETTPEQEVPVLVLDIDEAEADKLLLSLDPLAALAETNAQALDTLLREVDTGSEGLQEMYADLAEAADLYKDEPAEVVEDEVPEPPAEPITKPGDLWLLGDHRLLCGDSTDPRAVARLTGSEAAAVIFTDPPYGIDYSDVQGRFEKIANDADDPTDLVAQAIALQPAAAVYLCCNWRCLHAMTLAMEASGLKPKATIVWDKGSRIQNLDRYAKRHELIVYAGPYGGQVTLDDDVWEISRETRQDHPTAKPVELCGRAIQHASDPGAIVFDPFLGSGSTLIAAEQLDRRCYGMEISPAYCDVIVKRWETLTGKQATLEVPNGKTRATARADDTEDSQRQPRKAAAKQARAKARK